MWKRIFGAALFVWMAAAAIGVIDDLLSHQGVREGTAIASLAAFAAMALIGLVMAVAPTKQPPPDDKGAGQTSLRRRHRRADFKPTRRQT